MLLLTLFSPFLSEGSNYELGNRLNKIRGDRVLVDRLIIKFGN